MTMNGFLQARGARQVNRASLNTYSFFLLTVFFFGLSSMDLISQKERNSIPLAVSL